MDHEKESSESLDSPTADPKEATLRRLMTPVPSTVALDDSAEIVWEKMHLFGVHQLVVVDEGSAIGVVYDRDLAGVHGTRKRAHHTAADFICRRVMTMKPSITLDEALRRIRGHSAVCIVVEEAGQVTGTITFDSLLLRILDEASKQSHASAEHG